MERIKKIENMAGRYFSKGEDDFHRTHRPLRDPEPPLLLAIALRQQATNELLKQILEQLVYGVGGWQANNNLLKTILKQFEQRAGE